MMQPTPSPSPSILLLFPPQCQSALRGPHLATPQLAAYVQANGLAARTRDLNIGFFRHLTAPAYLQRYMDELAERRDALHARAELDAGEIEELLRLHHMDGLRKRLADYDDDALLSARDFHRALPLVLPLLEGMPGAFEDILEATRSSRSDVLTRYYDELDLGELCAGAAMVGISVAFHLQLYPALELARRVRAHAGDGIPIVLGGSQISLLADEQKHALAGLPFVDAVVVHEGEVPLLEIGRQLAAEGRVDFSRVPNAYYCDAGQVREPTWHCPLSMDELPTPVFNAEELHLYRAPRTLPVYVSKGCYWGKCKFCDYTKLYTPGQAKTQAWAVFRSPERLAGDIEAMQTRYGVSGFYLVSEAITPAYYPKLGKNILARGLDVQLSSYCRVEKSYDFRFFQELYAAGVRALTFGVESTEDRILALIEKGNTVADVRNTIRHARAAGIDVQFNLIPDYPTIRWDDVQRTVAFIRENIDFISHLNHQFFELSNNSSIVDEEKEHGLTVHREQRIQTNHGLHSLAYTRNMGLTPNQLRRIRTLFNALASDLAVYQRTRDLVNLTRSEHFDWNRAMFVLAGDMDAYKLHFDPSEPKERDGKTYFARLDKPMLILASWVTRRQIPCAPAVSSVIDAAAAKGIFTIDDVLAQVAGTWKLKSAEKYRPAIIQCLQALLHEGFVEKIFHPWLGAPGERVASLLHDGELAPVHSRSA